MPAKKTKIKFEATGPTKPAVKKQIPICKTKCGRKGLVGDGWCSACFAKHQKGYFTSTGDISPEVIRRQKEVEDKRRRRAQKKEIRKLESIKEELSNTLTSPMLRVLSSSNEDFDKPKYCEKLAFWTSDSICYSRLFVSQNKKCSKCKVHDSALPNLLELTKDAYVKTTTPATAEVSPSPTISDREFDASTTAAE